MNKKKELENFSKAENTIIELIDWFHSQRNLMKELQEYVNQNLGPEYLIEHNNRLPSGIYEITDINLVSVAYIWYDENLNPVLITKPTLNLKYLTN